MLNTTNIDKQAVFAAENRYAERMKENGLDASPGSAIRELVVRPSAVLSELEEEWRQELISSLNLNAIADGTVEGDDTLVDALASIYRIQRKGGSSSAGSINLEIDYTGSPVYVNQSWSFTADGHDLLFSGVYAGSLDGTAGGGLVKKERLVRYPSAVADDGTVTYSYSMLIPVTCPDGSDIAAGTPVEVRGPSSAVKSASVFSPVTGGGDRETNQELAKRILEALPPGVMSTPLQIRNTLCERFGRPVDRTSVMGGQDGIPRARDIITGFAMPGFADIYTAMKGDCPVDVITVDAVPVEGYTGIWRIVLEPPVSAGVYDVVSIYADGNRVQQISTMTWEAVDSERHIVPAGCHRFSSYQKVTMTFVASGSGSTLPCTVSLRKQPDIQAIQDFVDNSDRRAPGQDILVKAATPFFLSVGVTVEKGAPVSLETMKEAICSHISALPVGRGYVSGQDIMDALNP